MLFKIASPQGIIFEWDVSEVILPTESWSVTVYPNHTPLITMIKPWLISLTPTNTIIPSTWWQYIFDGNHIIVSVSKGVALMDGKSIKVTANAVTSSPSESQDKLHQMKEHLQQHINRIRSKGNMEEIEKTIIQLEKVNADMKLSQIQQ